MMKELEMFYELKSYIRNFIIFFKKLQGVKIITKTKSSCLYYYIEF